MARRAGGSALVARGLRYHPLAMPSMPRLRGQSSAEHAPAPIVLPTLPIDLESVHTRRVRKAVGYTRNVATVATAVPFMPLPARVAAGALTGVAAVVDSALRPSSERPAVPAKPAPTDDDILHDPALFAADAAGALATGVLAAGEALVVTARSPLLRRTLKVGLVASVVITVGALGYKLVVGPALVRRRERRSREMALIVLPEAGATGAAGAAAAAEGTAPVPISDADAPVGGGEVGIADVLAEAVAEPIVEVLVVEDDVIESVEDSTVADAAPADEAAEARADDGAAAEAPAAAEAEPAPKKRRFGRRSASTAPAEGSGATESVEDTTAADPAPAEAPSALPSQD